MHMEEDLKELAESDLADPNRVMYSKDWWSLAEDEETDSEKKQWRKVVQIREALKEYSMIPIPLILHTASIPN